MQEHRGCGIELISVINAEIGSVPLLLPAGDSGKIAEVL